VPTFDKSKWDKEGPGGPAGRSNCYNYALDLPCTGDKGKKLQPGQQNGHTLKHPYECSDVTEGAKKDNLTISDAKTACTKGCWKVALFIAPPGDVGKDGDFHWYRQDDDGSWSHKMDSMDPSQVDNSGKKITDPEKADTGTYKFCNYFCVCPDEVKKKVSVAMAGPYSTPEYAVRTPYVTCVFTSGADNPSWLLAPAELAAVRERLADLPRSDLVPTPRLGESGFFVDTGIDLIQVYGGVIAIARGGSFEDARGLGAWLHQFAQRKQQEGAMPYSNAGGVASGGDPQKGVATLKSKLKGGCITGKAHRSLERALGQIERALGQRDVSPIAIACESFLLGVRRRMGTAISLSDANEFFETVTTQIKHPFCGPAQMYVDAMPFARDFQRIEIACNLNVELPHQAGPDPATVRASCDALMELVSTWDMPEEDRGQLMEMVQALSRLSAGEEPASEAKGTSLLSDFGAFCQTLEDDSLARTQANFLRGYVVYGGIGSLCPLPGWWKLTQLAILIPVAIYVVVSGIRTAASHTKVKKAAEVIDEYLHDDPPHSKLKVSEKAKEAAKDLTPEQKRELKKILQEALDNSKNLDQKQKALMREAINALADDEEEKNK
jgi:uncharacterized membrane protein